MRGDGSGKINAALDAGFVLALAAWLLSTDLDGVFSDCVPLSCLGLLGVLIAAIFLGPHAWRHRPLRVAMALCALVVSASFVWNWIGVLQSRANLPRDLDPWWFVGLVMATAVSFLLTSLLLWAPGYLDSPARWPGVRSGSPPESEQGGTAA